MRPSNNSPIIMFIAALVVAINNLAEAKVVTWPAAEGTATTNDFAMSVNGKPIDIIKILASKTLDYSAAFFDADEKVKVRISSKRDLSNVRILPLSRGIKPKHIDANTISFEAKPPFRISVEPDGRERSLIVKASLPEVNPPKKGDPKVIYIGPGRHRKPEFVVPSGYTLYLAPGAWVEGSVYGTGTNITVRGRGVISGNPWPWNKGPGRMLVLSGENFRVDGINLVGSWGWTCWLNKVRGALVTDIAVLCGRCINDDGIDVYNSRDVTIRDSFFRTQDDCIAPKHYVENLLVENCELWADVANAIRVGHENSFSFGMRNLVFRNIDVLHQARHNSTFDDGSWVECVVNMESSNDKIYSNMLFEDFRIDSPTKGSNLAVLAGRPIKNVWHDYKTAGNIRNVVFRNFTINGEIPEGAENVMLWSHDPDHTVEGVEFENIDPRVKILVRGASTYRHYRVSWEGAELSPQMVNVSAMPFNRVWPGHQRDISQTERAAFVRFDAEKKGIFEVKAKGIGKGEVTIHPLSAAGRLQVSDDKVSIALNGPELFVLGFGGRFPALHVFGDKPIADIPRPKHDGRLLRFGPGVHNPGVIIPKSGDVIWLDEGALVNCELLAVGVRDVVVAGRGTMSSAGFTRMDERAQAARRSVGMPPIDVEHACSPFVVYGSTNVVFRGITLTDAPFWTLVIRNQSKGVLVDNVKIVGNWRYNSDGIDICASSDVTVRDCFLRTFDDCVIARGPSLPGEYGAVTGVLVENCVLWCDWGCNVKLQVHDASPSLIDGVTVRNSVFARLTGSGVLAATRYGSDSDTIRNLTVEDIELDFAPVAEPQVQTSDDAKFVDKPIGAVSVVCAYAYGIGKSLGDQRTGELGDPNWYRILYENLAFRRMKAYGKPPRLSVDLKTKLPNHRIRGVTLDDLPEYTLNVSGNVSEVTEHR